MYNVVLGIGCVVVAAAIAIYYSMPNAAPPHAHQQVIRIDLPGDICSICREPMEPHTMEYLKCEHALHQTCLRLYKRNNYKSCPVCKRSL